MPPQREQPNRNPFKRFGGLRRGEQAAADRGLLEQAVVAEANKTEQQMAA
jgi:hypothetical protein